MIALIQRVSGSNVLVNGHEIARIGIGLLVLVGVEREDGPKEASKLASRIVNYRVFKDAAGKMNKSAPEVGGEILLIPQFTLVADTGGGLRPSFSRAAPPDVGAAMFDSLVAAIAATGIRYACGRFGADMQVTLTNDGPVTFWLQASPAPPAG
jgi:D-tyrosyl-tRNA(Tyr) deacylase